MDSLRLRINLTLHQLEVFVEVARTTNFRGAALALHVSQPALSRTIRMIEEVIGTRLFDRDTRHVAITPAGHKLLPIAMRILEDFNSAFSELSQFLDGNSGQVTVAALPSAGVALLADAMASFRRNSPQVQLSFIEGPADMLRDALDQGRADFAISVRPEISEPMQYRHLFDDPFILLCRHDDVLASKARLSWSAFATRPFIASKGHSSIRPITDAAFIQKGLHVVPAFEYPSVAAGGAMVAAGLGITALPRLALRLIHGNELVAVPLIGPAMSRSIGLVTRVGRTLSPACRALIAHLERTVSVQASGAVEKPRSGKLPAPAR